MTERVLVTGAAGVVGTLMRPRLRKAGPGAAAARPGAGQA